MTMKLNSEKLQKKFCEGCPVNDERCPCNHDWKRCNWKAIFKETKLWNNEDVEVTGIKCKFKKVEETE